MRTNTKKTFTLAEVMIVLLILTILFAAFAPVITKRRKNISKNPIDLWQWSTRDYFNGPMDIFYSTRISDNDTDKGSLFFGISPNSQEDLENLYFPYSKIIVRSGDVTSGALPQRQLQFRYGRLGAEDIGSLSGSVLMDTKNIFMGGSYPDLMQANTINVRSNVAIGYNAMNSVSSTASYTNNTAVGSNALTNLISGSKNVAVGSHSGYFGKSESENTFVGYKAGYNATGSGNTLLGSYANSGSGNYNIFIGTKSGPQGNYALSSTGSYNVGIGYNAMKNLQQGSYNVAIGTFSLPNLTDGSYNTAIGYRACSGLVKQNYKTCIGYNSGPQYANDYMENSSQDSVQRTYIGSSPKRRFGGDAVLEIHNMGPENSNANNFLNNNPAIKSNTTTIMNADLLVRGKIYFTVGNRLLPFDIDSGSHYPYFGANTAGTCNINQTSYTFNTANCPGLDFISGGSSDRRLKNIHSKSTTGIDKIRKINVYNYTFKNDADKKTHVGVIAQELQKIFPQSVTSDKNGYLKIRWDEMFYASVNAIKELNKKLTALIKDTVTLEKQITKLESENKTLQTEVDNISKKIDILKNKK